MASWVKYFFFCDCNAKPLALAFLENASNLLENAQKIKVFLEYSFKTYILLVQMVSFLSTFILRKGLNSCGLT